MDSGCVLGRAVSFVHMAPTERWFTPTIRANLGPGYRPRWRHHCACWGEMTSLAAKYKGSALPSLTALRRSRSRDWLPCLRRAISALTTSAKAQVGDVKRRFSAAEYPSIRAISSGRRKWHCRAPEAIDLEERSSSEARGLVARTARGWQALVRSYRSSREVAEGSPDASPEGISLHVGRVV